MNNRIRFDYNNLMADRLGAYGLSQAGLETSGRLAAQASQWFYAKREAGKMDFFDLPDTNQHLKASLKMAAKCKGKYHDLVVLGIGGSALGTIAIHSALNPPTYNLQDKKTRRGRPRLWVLDNVDPEKLKAVLSLLKAKKTLVNLISKSGTTAETSAQFLWIRQWLIKGAGKSWSKNMVVTTDPAGGIMRQIVNREKLSSLEVPSGVGGRFSVLTPVGLFPLAMAGVDIKSLLDGANQLRKMTLNENPWKNPARLYALTQYLLYQKGCRINVMMPYSDSLYPMADWFRQLWAESLGKRLDNKNQTVETGPTPIKALGATDQHSQLQLYIEGPRDKAITFLRVEKFRNDIIIPKAYPKVADISYLGGKTFGQLLNAEARATAMALAKNGRPNCSFIISEISPRTIGQLIFLLETATAYAGGLFGINPMDQPGVEEGKRYTYGLMGRAGFENRKAEVEKFEAGNSKKYIV
ncbi:MAG: glucose-6-phosphate isomerase [Candidatus Edwardsbacteria bacterium]|nr:glucose-6-phosphate isomerase [Candidatus Edwardsbacteria bacterium]MBU1575724.1 glucose-6-phosphate isomerase [Candidatus Edwardsbacteria bacterium]MBU2462575.1 glucose-6-phosphate isomerase [Candidatus Edwardsbacteria bacterium]MBU2594226.1 glucose-6-phosphate isomerase [Candidatus Edwardsbacteria bacterium]